MAPPPDVELSLEILQGDSGSGLIPWTLSSPNTELDYIVIMIWVHVVSFINELIIC